MKAPAKIFISYSHKDAMWKDELVRHLSSLRNQELIDDWTDNRIEPGFWDDQIVTAMESATIFILLVTHNFLGSEYITTREIQTAYKRFKEGKAKIIPVICDACKWELQPVTKTEKAWHEGQKRELYIWLGKFNALPKDAKPVRNWANHQDAFVDIIDCLMRELE